MNIRNVSDFIKGLMNNNPGRGKAPLNSLLEAENVRIHSGEAEPRQGQTYLNADYLLNDDDDSEITGQIVSIYQYTREYWDLPTDSRGFWREYIFSIGENLYAWTGDDADNAFWINEDFPLVNSDVWIAVYNDWAFIGDGVGSLKRYDAMRYSEVGIDPPVFESGDMAHGVTATDIKGFRRYKYRYIWWVRNAALNTVDYVASPWSDEVVSPVDFGQLSMLVTLEASDDVLANGIELYGTEVYDTISATDDKEFFLLTLVNNEDQVFEDRLSNKELINLATDHPPEDTTEDWTHPPDGLSLLIFYKDRIYGVAKDDPSVGRYCNLGEPEQWPANSYMAIREDDGDVITGIAVRGNSLYWFKNHSIWVMTGDPEAEPMLEHITGGEMTGSQTEVGIGCTASRSLASYDAHTLIFYSKYHGVYMISGGQLTHISKYVDVPLGLADTTSGVVYVDAKGEPFYVLSPPTGDAYVCHLPSRTWVTDTNVNVRCFCVDNQARVMGGTDGRINRYYDPDTDTDNDSIIWCKLRPNWLNLRNGIMGASVRGIQIQSRDMRDACMLTLFNESDEMQFTTTFDSDNVRVGIDGVGQRLFSTRLVWNRAVIESMAYFYLKRVLR